MKYTVLFSLFLFGTLAASGQQPLPPKLYQAMRDSTTSIDVVYMTGEGKSLSLDERSVRAFNTFFENKTAKKTQAVADASIMWLERGRELLSGNLFFSDSVGYVVVTHSGKEYVNRISNQGTSFFQGQIKEK